MIFLRHFEENLEALGFDLAPLAWDLAQLPYANESERREVLNDIIRRGDASGDNAAG
jgi:hypothetical protein